MSVLKMHLDKALFTLCEPSNLCKFVTFNYFILKKKEKNIFIQLFYCSNDISYSGSDIFITT